MNRPDYEKLYRLCYRRYHELLSGIDEAIQMRLYTCPALTLTDMTETLQKLYDKHTISDWEGNK